MASHEPQRAVCAIGALRTAQPPLLMGSGFCVDGTRRIFCSCAHVWHEIKATCLDPAADGVAIGLRPTDQARAERGEIDWVGRAVLLTPPGVLNPPSTTSPDGLDLVVLQLTQQLDGSPLVSLDLVALPLGDADTLDSGDQLTVLGFGVPSGHERGNARPKYPKFSTIATHENAGVALQYC